MSVKSVVEDEQEINYPCLMIGLGGMIVLFNKKGCGTIVSFNSSPIDCIGEYQTNWVMSCFNTYTGKVELSNN